MTNRGIRNNNPVNIVSNENNDWKGLTGSDGHFCVFVDAFHGIRAAALNFLAYRLKHDLTTIRGLIARHAPASENDTDAYVSRVCADTGFGPDDDFDIDNADNMCALLKSVIAVENGEQPYDDELITNAVIDALG